MPDPTPESLPAVKLELARSNRSKCKGCKKPIQKDHPRLGVLIEGPFGPGYLWFHVKCGARRRFEDVTEAYAALDPKERETYPPLEQLQEQLAVEEKKKEERLEPPYAERAKTNRSKCRQCGEMVEKDAFRVILLRKVEFFNQVRSGPINVHPRCVKAALEAPDNATETTDLAAQLRANSKLEPADVDELMAQIR